MEDLVFYIIDDNKNIYWYSFGSFFAKIHCDIVYRRLSKKRPNKIFYKVEESLLSLISSSKIDVDFWGERYE